MASLLRRATDDIGLDKSHAHLEPRHAFRDPQIEHIAWALHAEQSEGSPGGLVYTETLGLALAIRLLRSHAAVQSFRGGLSKLRLRRLTEHIEAHLDQDLSLRELAAVAGVSVSHLKTQFRHSTGTAVHQYVIQRRVERAKTLLASGKLSISQVALESGFAHQSHMARCMRRILGVTPTALLRG